MNLHDYKNELNIFMSKVIYFLIKAYYSDIGTIGRPVGYEYKFILIIFYVHVSLIVKTSLKRIF